TAARRTVRRSDDGEGKAQGRGGESALEGRKAQDDEHQAYGEAEEAREGEGDDPGRRRERRGVGRREGPRDRQARQEEEAEGREGEAGAGRARNADDGSVIRSPRRARG